MELPNLKSIITSGIGSITEGAANIISKLKADPTKVAEAESALEQLKINAELEGLRIANQAEEIQAKELETVNETMRQESKSEHFLTYSWRPLIGYCLIAVILSNYIVLPYLKKYGLLPVEIPTEMTYTMMAILGVASVGRAATKWQTEKNKQ